MQRIEPRGAARDDLRIALLNASVVNTIRGAAGSKGEPVKVSELTLGALLGGQYDET
jgi:hypothetical protein